MNLILKNLTIIEGGLSQKKVYRHSSKKLNRIVIDFSNDEKEFQNFLNVYEILKKINISIPRIYEVYWKKKLIIMEDFGIKNFNKIFEEKEIYNLLKLAVDNLIIIHNSIILDNLAKLKKYNFNCLKQEISEFVKYFIPYKKIYDFPVNNFYKYWKKAYDYQEFEFSSFVHKDFEFINLILLENKNLHLKCGIIDFQSAFIGFEGWDLFSILENPRLIFPRTFNENLIKYYYDNVKINKHFESFRQQYYLLNLARQTRLLGRWIKLSNMGNNEYERYIVPTQKRIISCLNNIENDKLQSIYKKVLIN